MSKPTLKYLALDKVKPPKEALRTVDQRKQEYLELVDSVRNKGVMNAILVREVKDDPDHQWQVVEGLHRYSAALDAGLTEIPAQIMSMSDVEVYEAQIIGNLHKIETKPAEYAAALQKLFLNNPTLTKKELAQKVNKSTTWIDNQLKLTVLSERVAKLVNDGAINVSNAYTLADLASVSPDEVENYLEQAQTTAPNEFNHKVDQRVRQIKAERKAGRDPAKKNEYVAEPFPRKKQDLLSEMSKPEVGPTLIKKTGATTPEEGFALAVQWSLKMDVLSIEEGRRQWEIEKAKADENKKARQAQREEERAKKAQENLANV